MAAWSADELAGFWIADHYRYTYEHDRYIYFSNVCDSICSHIGLDRSRVGCGAQCVVDIPYQGTGLRRLLLFHLLLHLSDRFEALFSKIAKDNLRAMKGHLSDGWIQIDEDNQEAFVFIDVHVGLKQLSSMHVSSP